MRTNNWNDLRYLLAVQRGRTLAAAARLLHVDNTTVSRRIAALEDTIGKRLCERSGEGLMVLTPEGEKVAEHAAQMELHAQQIDQKLASSEEVCAGTVRLTSVPILVNRLLLPALGPLLQRHPALQIDLIPDSRDFSLTRREADLALRLSRPKTGGTQVKARKIADMDYAAYALGDVNRNQNDLPWITYGDIMAHLPQARWMANETRGQADQRSNLRVYDGESALEAVLSGLGKSLLPAAVGDRIPRLQRIGMKIGSSKMSRELWLLGHTNQMKLRHIQTVIAWADELFQPSQCNEKPLG